MKNVILFAAEAIYSMFCFSTVQAKLAAAQTANHDGQTKLTQQIQQLHGENEITTRKTEGLGSQLKQG